MSVYDKRITLQFENDETWSIAVKEIADNRAAYYAGVDDTSVEESLKDTLELFESDTYEIEDWACGSMDWDDFTTKRLEGNAVGFDYQAEFCNADWNRTLTD